MMVVSVVAWIDLNDTNCDVWSDHGLEMDSWDGDRHLW